MNTKIVYHTITPGSATLSYEGQVKTFSSETPEYQQIRDLVKNGDNDGLIKLLTEFKNKIESASDKFKVRDDIVFIKNDDGSEDSLPRTLGQRLVEFSKDGLPVDPILNFWKRLNGNPSNSAVHRLFECLEHNHHPLTPDGKFLAWKKVRGNYKDIHSGKFDNSPGKLVKVKRNQVDENMDQTCSFGLHVASYSYACDTYGVSEENILLEVVVDPADVVAIPRDYNNQKMRVCGYEVVRVCKEENKNHIYDPYEENDECEDCGEDLGDCDCEDDYDDEEYD